MVYIGKVGAPSVPAVPFDHIFQAQEQVRHRRAFLEAVAVIGVFRAIAQRTHKLRYLYIGRAGKCGNTVIAIQCTIVERLGVGGFCPVKQGILLPLVHIANHGLRRIGSLGIVLYAGTGEIQSECHQCSDQLYEHYADHHDPRRCPALTSKYPYLLKLLLIRIPGKACPKLTIKQRRNIQSQESPIIYNVYRNRPFPA